MAEITASGKLIQRNSSVSKESDPVAINIVGTIESSTPDRLSPNRCIYKVPDHLRKSNEKSYTPQVISIGPLHHGNKKLQDMEKYKVKYLNDFLLRTNKSMEDLESIVKPREKEVRERYAEEIEFNSNEFVKMILHDAIFIIEYFSRNMFPKQWTDEHRIVKKPWRTARLQLDFLLLENQLPFFIIEKLYELLLITFPYIYPAFIEVTSHYFDFFNPQRKSTAEYFPIMHFVDLLRSFYLPPESYILSRYPSNNIEEMYSASQLTEAGLIFKKSSSRCQLDIKFKDGVLEIPGFTLDEHRALCSKPHGLGGIA